MPPAGRRRGPRRRPGRRRQPTVPLSDPVRRTRVLPTQGYEGNQLSARWVWYGVDPALVLLLRLQGGTCSRRSTCAYESEIATAISGDLSAGPRLVRLSLTAWDDDADGATCSLPQWMATDTRSPTRTIGCRPWPDGRGPEQSGLSVTSPRERATLAGSQLVGSGHGPPRAAPGPPPARKTASEVVGPTIQRYSPACGLGVNRFTPRDTSLGTMAWLEDVRLAQKAPVAPRAEGRRRDRSRYYGRSRQSPRSCTPRSRMYHHQRGAATAGTIERRRLTAGELRSSPELEVELPLRRARLILP